jgi:hypothetical protein
MLSESIESTAGLIDLTFSDWEGQRRVALDGVPRNATVAELVHEVRRMLELPADTEYGAVLNGLKLPNMQTLDEAGIESESTLEIHPEVSAGSLVGAASVRERV